MATVAAAAFRPNRFEKPTLPGSGNAMGGGGESSDAAAAAKKKSASGETGLLSKLSIVADNLETYQGRDTLITLFHYIALILADLFVFFKLGGKKNSKRMSEHLVNLFVQLSNCRVMLRLLDDFGAIRDFYRFYKDEGSKVRVRVRVRVCWCLSLIKLYAV